jgi:hypothetical protein
MLGQNYKWGEVKYFCSVVMKRPKVKKKKKWGVQWSEVMILGEMCIWLLIYTVRKFCVVCYLIIICFSTLFSNYIDLHYLIFFGCLIFVFYYVYSLLLYCFVYSFSFCAVSFLSVYKSTNQCPGGNPIAVSKYHIIHRIFSNLICTLFTVSEGWKIRCGLESRSWAGFWKNDKSRCMCRKNNTIQ